MKLILLIVLFPLTAFSRQDEAALSGFVKSAKTGETLIGATVRAGASGAVTNKSGYFVLRSLPVGKTDIVTTYLGYKKNTQSVFINTGQTKITIALEEEDV